MTLRRLQQIMTGESVTAELLNRMQHEHALEARVRRALPPSLAACVVVADGRSPELRVLAAEGCEFTGIRVRVQAHPKSRSRANPSKKQIDAPAALHLRVTADALGDSPLADALMRLARCAALPDSEQQERPPEGEKHEHDEQ